MTVMARGFTEGTADGTGTDRYRARLARGTLGRPALEVYVQGGLYDVAVADGFARSLLRGAVQGPGWALAWGQLPPDGADVQVAFTGRHVDLSAGVRVLGDRFWVAEADVRARRVVVDTPSERAALRVATVSREGRWRWPWSAAN
ncbi:hypothetical protein [Actinomadura rupiterrae]|uniref:hypothetical protein n=1 Tax=Actinomadura rupiterrae TaxID=559627 RepID=UPI0020A235D9|nr:hypothetical protein [Actinomadura rupiterrae]MCP2341762.1 hypothetical protein [Actinomadura rupiterrae]